MAIRKLVCVTALGFSVAGTGGAAAQSPTNTLPPAVPRLPIVILIVADGLGYGDLGCYGQEKIQTPRIDELAARGVRFTDFHAGGASDFSSQAAVLTGQAFTNRLPANTGTLAENLREAGYRTGFIGYWGLGGFDSANAPQKRGFDEVIVYGDHRHAQELYARHLYRRDPHTGFEGAVPVAGNPPGKQGVYLPDLLTQAATRFCKQNKPENLNQYRPFFLLLHYPVPAAVAARSGPVPPTDTAVEPDWPALQQDKANAIARLDQHVGEILDELAKRDIAQNTLVLLTSSAGPEGETSFEPGFFQSTGAFTRDDQPLAEGRLRVPLLVQWPFWKQAGQVSDLLLTGQDIYPTVLEAARLKAPPGLEVISFLPVLQGQAQTHLHEHLTWTAVDEEGHTHHAVRQAQWKATRPGTDQPWRLYDLTADPGERTDLAESQSEVLGQLRTQLETPVDTNGNSPAPASVRQP